LLAATLNEVSAKQAKEKLPGHSNKNLKNVIKSEFAEKNKSVYMLRHAKQRFVCMLVRLSLTDLVSSAGSRAAARIDARTPRPHWLNG